MLSFTEVIIASAIVGVLAGLVSGTISALTGGSFAEGFATGLMSGFIATALALVTGNFVLAMSVGTLIATLVMELATGRMEEAPAVSMARILVATLIAAAGGAFLGGAGSNIFTASAAELVPLLTEAAITKATLASLGRILGQMLLKGVFMGVVQSLAGLMNRVAILMYETLLDLTEQRRLDIEKALRETGF